MKKEKLILCKECKKNYHKKEFGKCYDCMMKVGKWMTANDIK